MFGPPPSLADFLSHRDQGGGAWLLRGEGALVALWSQDSPTGMARLQIAFSTNDPHLCLWPLPERTDWLDRWHWAALSPSGALLETVGQHSPPSHRPDFRPLPSVAQVLQHDDAMGFSGAGGGAHWLMKDTQGRLAVLRSAGGGAWLSCALVPGRGFPVERPRNSAAQFCPLDNSGLEAPWP